MIDILIPMRVSTSFPVFLSNLWNFTRFMVWPFQI